MDIFFLEATYPKVRVSKRFVKRNDGTIEKHQFPNVVNWTSHKHDVESLDEMIEALRLNADLGRVLIKGRLTRDLTDERRKGTTETNAPTPFLCLDIDGIPGFTSPEQFTLNCLPQTMHNVSYIWQPSASAGILPQRGLSGHIFFMLESEIMAPALKEWLRHLNMHYPSLRENTRLSAGDTSLSYPLDITVCQSDKLIYIAPPELEGIQDPITDRFTLYNKTHPRLDLDISKVKSSVNDTLIGERINELRKAAGLKAKEPKYKTRHGEHVLANPDRAQITGPIKYERGFVYLQLNGSDSWNFWHPENNPTILRSWKGDPPMLMADILPEYAIQLTNEQKGKNTDPRYLAFRDEDTDSYYNAIVDADNGTAHLVAASSKDKMKDFMANYGARLPDPIPDWRLHFDPTSDIVVDAANQKINRFQKSEYLKAAENLPPVSSLPPLTDRLITSVTGNDPESKEYFINWLAYTFQERRKTPTAWILRSSVEGAGKGVLFSKILAPVLGFKYCQEKMLSDLNDQFNAWMEDCLLLFIDESKMSKASDLSGTIERIRNLVTDEVRNIRAMRANPAQRHVYFNIIFASNYNAEAAYVPPSDRRFNISPIQHEKLEWSFADHQNIDNERLDFARFIMNYKIDTVKATTCMQNEAKKELQDNCRTSHDTYFDALQAGDLDFFIDFAFDTPPPGNVIRHAEYVNIIKRWARELDTPVKVSRSELHAVYSYLQDNSKISTNKFSRMLSLNGLKPEPMRISSAVVARGIYRTWTASQPLVDILLNKPTSGLSVVK